MTDSGLSDLETTLLIVAVFLPPLLLALINVSKGKYWTAFVGFFFVGLVSLVGAIRLAKPNSKWARDYNREKMSRAMRRFPKHAKKVPADWQPPHAHEPEPTHLQDSDLWPDEDPALWDKTTRRAYKKQHGRLPES